MHHLEWHLDTDPTDPTNVPTLYARGDGFYVEIFRTETPVSHVFLMVANILQQDSPTDWTWFVQVSGVADPEGFCAAIDAACATPLSEWTLHLHDGGTLGSTTSLVPAPLSITWVRDGIKGTSFGGTRGEIRA
jgi:hypothetical protein